ncbi:erythromycin esterase family protein [Sphingobacterium sp. ML3W]|uniref:erythromycin esterase family protein n=1 Tax=Sphingobacterium sp. ML3W TaxID=1538644 RepID=UPI00249A98A8|nr:erythromycin esterase family protein [Sphingobacterium sp. ML3W]WFA79608.1 erythromycin esterase family protein [Sphingobacterium sp. ML3W]
MKRILLAITALIAIVLIFNKLIYNDRLPPNYQALRVDVDRNKAVINSISMMDSNFSDLRVFDRILKNNRILMLGEMQHDDGETFRAKSRLIRYLREKLDYNIVLYEAGQYDMWVMNREMDRPTMQLPKQSLAGLGLFDFWWRNNETDPLINYYQKSKLSGKPITLGGFDIQFSGRLLADKRAKLLADFCLKNKIGLKDYPLLKKELNNLEYLALARYANRKLDSTAKRQLLSEIGKLRHALRASGGNEEQRVYSRYLADIKTNYEKSWSYAPGSMASMQLRDSLMAQNLQYQIDSLYPGKKIIVWCANIHTFSTAYNKEYLPLGAYIKKKYGHQAYMLDFSSYGKKNDAGQIVGKPGKLAIENLFHQTGVPYFFLDLRGLPDTSLLRRPFVSVINQGIEEERKWTDYIDGIFYIDLNKRPTYLER